MERALQRHRPVRLRLLRWLTPLTVFASLLFVFSLVNRSDDAADAPAAADVSSAGTGGDTEALVAELQTAVAADPANAANSAALGNAFYQRARETGDAAFYSLAEGAFAKSLASDSEQVTAITGQATLALARHDFAAALELAERARAIEPDLLAPYPALVDAQIELGRYEQGAATLDRLISLKPTLASYSRVSYFRELNGDLPGALEAMRLAVSAASGSGENAAYVQALLGKLQSDLGNYGGAERSYRLALAADRSYLPALAGLASVEAGRGDFEPAIRRLEQVVEALPLPQYAIALGEAQEAAGQLAAARDSYGLVEIQTKLQEANGINTDVELAIFEADHGSSAKAVELARDAWRSAPSVRSADALSWALSAAGDDSAASRFSAEAMKLDSRDPTFLYHAGMIAQADGRTADANRHLGVLVEQSPSFNPLYGPRAEQALEDLR